MINTPTLATCALKPSRRWHGQDVAAFVFDIDGTLDDGTKGNIYPPVILRMAEWLERGTNLFFVTNRPASWVWRKLLVPIAAQSCLVADGRVFAACEQGAVIAELVVTDDAIRLATHQTWPLDDREALEAVVRQAIARGDLRGRIRDELRFQVCVEELREVRADVAEWLPASIREAVQVLRTRSTLTLFSRRAGKEAAIRYLQSAHPELWEGHVLGFGDDADEFARVVPVLDVDRNRRDLFRMNGLRGVPAYLPDALQRLGLPTVPMTPELEADVAIGGGQATSAYLAALSVAVDASPFYGPGLPPRR